MTMLLNSLACHQVPVTPSARARAIAVCAAFLTVWLAGSGVAAAACDATCEAQFVTANNLVRTKLNSGLMPAAAGLFQPTAAPPLPALSLDSTLATGAQNWANVCSFGHSGTPGRGENVYASAGAPLTPVIAVADWASESTAYKYAVIGSPLNDPSAVSHYTQLVWANTTLVGCGITQCTTNSPFGAAFPTWDFAVCQYSPPGNFTGQFPYIAGAAPVGGGPLDADGDGRYDALTDGLIIIRYLFGITGPSLTSGVLGAGATVMTPEAMLIKLNGTNDTKVNSVTFVGGNQMPVSVAIHPDNVTAFVVSDSSGRGERPANAPTRSTSRGCRVGSPPATADRGRPR